MASAALRLVHKEIGKSAACYTTPTTMGLCGSNSLPSSSEIREDSLLHKSIEIGTVRKRRCRIYLFLSLHHKAFLPTELKSSSLSVESQKMMFFSSRLPSLTQVSIFQKKMAPINTNRPFLFFQPSERTLGKKKAHKQ